MTAPDLTVLDLITRAATAAPDAPAVLGVEAGSLLTYRNLEDRMRAVGQALRAHGIGPTDVVLVSLPNGPDFLVAILSAMRAAISVPVNPAYTLDEVMALAAATAATAVLVAPGDAGPVAQAAERAGLTTVTFAPNSTESGDPLDSPKAGALALLLHTAGTTARPKQVPLTHGNLVAAARNVVTALGLTSGDRCLGIMPLFHSQGLIGAALSTFAAGGSIVCAPGVDPRAFFGWAERWECTWYTAAPTVHHLIVHSPGEWGGCRVIRSAAHSLPPQLARDLEVRLGAPVIEAYGMTEAYQIAANPLPPGERRPGSVGRATGTDIAILDEEGSIQPTGEGEVLVRGPAAFQGYASPPEANVGAFHGGWFRTGDLGTLGPDGYLTLTGRVKDLINRAGEKISPREVEEVFLDHAAVEEAVAFAFPDPTLGEDIAVAVVLTPGAAVDVPALRIHLASRLAAYKVPRRIVTVESIPTSSTGKPLRRVLAQDFVDGRLRELTTGTAIAPPTTDSSEGRLAGIWAAVLGLNVPPTSSDRFFDLGGDSLAVMEMVVRIEDEFGVSVPLLDVHAVPSLGQLARRIDTAAREPSDSLLLRYRSGDAATNVILIPGQVGNAVGLNLIADAMGLGPTIHLFDYPGHRPGQEPARTIEAIAGHLVTEIEQADLGGRLVLYGNSMGSWVALEAARVLAEQGRRPALVGIGDMYSPWFNTHRAGERPPLGRRLASVLRRARRRLRHAAALSDTSGSGPAARQRESAVTAASELARRAYRPHPYDGDLLVVSTSPRAQKFGETLGYERHVTGRITPLRVGGGHSEMHREQAVPIGQALARFC